MTQAQIIALINSSVVFGTVILFGAVGEILTEKGGNLNLGVPGIMYMGGIAGLIGTFYYEKAMGADAVTGAATVILAMGAGKTAAKGIDEYLRNK